MKLYIENYTAQRLANKMSVFNKYLIDTSEYLETYSNEAAYCIKNNKIYKINILDKKIIKYEKYYKNYTIVLDKSETIFEEAYQISADHIILDIKASYFALSKDSIITFIVIEYKNGLDFIIFDFYFEINEKVDIENKLFKEEINVFLSMLN
jgi:hypothetical protein